MSVPIYRLTTLQRPVFLVNSRLGLVTAATQKFEREVHLLKWHPFSRSYGANLPSSFTWILSSALGYSPHLRVSVWSTVSLKSNIEDFLGSLLGRVYGLGPPIRISELFWRICLPKLPTSLNPDNQNRDLLSLLRPPIVQTILTWYRNIKPVFHRLRLSASA